MSDFEKKRLLDNHNTGGLSSLDALRAAGRKGGRPISTYSVASAAELDHQPASPSSHGNGGVGNSSSGSSSYPHQPQLLSSGDEVLPDPKGLVVAHPRRARWLRIIAIVTAIAVLLVVLVPPLVIFLQPAPQQQLPPLSFDDFLGRNGPLLPSLVDVRWTAGNKFVYRDGDDLLTADASAPTPSCLVNHTDLHLPNNTTLLNYDSYILSADQSFVLFSYVTKKLYRHSMLSQYYLFDTAASTLVPFPDADSQLDYASFSPLTDPVHIAYVYANNIFIATIASGSTPSIVQVTTTGVPELFFNGKPDWVYEEEVLAAGSAMWWNSRSNLLLYLSFNDTLVTEWSCPYYEHTQYQSALHIRYPQPGGVNPTVTAFIYDLPNDVSVPLTFSGEPAGEYYFTQVVWSASETRAFVRRLNRAQTTSYLYTCLYSASKMDCKMFATNDAFPGGWIDTYDGALQEVGSGANAVLDIVPHPNSSYPQIIKYTSSGTSSVFLTAGDFEVSQIAGVDAAGTVYFVANKPNPQDRHVFSVSLTDTESAGTCLTCNTTCSYNSPAFSLSATYYVLSCLGSGVPYQQVVAVSAPAIPVYVLVNNTQSVAKLATFALGTTQFIQVPGASGTFYKASILYPPAFDPSQKYPVLFDVYGGPNSQRVDSRYKLGWSAYLASSLGYIVFSFDGRGTGGRGVRWENLVYLQLGKLEVEDALSVARYMKTLPYVDAARVAIWGWSYGGFLTSSVMASPAVVQEFAVGMAVAPVTDWGFYDSIYTERYMLTPQSNAQGYEVSALPNKAMNIPNGRFLLVHGLADDNVHFQNSAEFLFSLTEAFIDYRVQVYTNQDHSINRDGSTRHLYRLLTNFMQSVLGRPQRVP